MQGRKRSVWCDQLLMVCAFLLVACCAGGCRYAVASLTSGVCIWEPMPSSLGGGLKQVGKVPAVDLNQASPLSLATLPALSGGELLAIGEHVNNCCAMLSWSGLASWLLASGCVLFPAPLFFDVVVPAAAS